MRTLLQDMKYGLRMFAKNPSFTAVAVFSLALGIGAISAIFSVLNAILLQPLPYPDSDRLTMLWSIYANGRQPRVPASGPEWDKLRRRSRLFQDIAGVWVSNGALTGHGEPEQVRIGNVTFNFLSVLGIRPALGRSFLPEEQGSGAPTVIILSDGLWRRRFGADPQILGRVIQVEGQGYTVAGVMPGDFEIILPGDSNVPPDIQAWIPFHADLEKQPRDLAYLRLVGRLRPGVTVQQAQAEAGALASQLRTQFSEFADMGLGLEVVPLHQDATREVRPALLALFAAVGLVLLIACANVANLLLTRSSARQTEITIRGALGADRGRIVRQLLTESVLLSGLGAATGLLLSAWGLKGILSLRPESLSRIHVNFDWTVLGFTAAVSVVCGILFGLAPAMQSFHLDLNQGLKGHGRTSVRGGQRGQKLLVASEAALGFVLLIGAGLMIRTFFHVQNVDPGFRADHVLTFQIALPEVRYPNDIKREQFFHQLGKNLAVLPGIQSVGASSHLPLDDFPNWYAAYWPEGTPVQEQNAVLADHRAILPGYFDSLGVSLIAGRTFDDHDDASHRKVVIVDESIARHTWPNESAVGKKLSLEAFDNWSFVRTWAEVVGVVKHVRYHELTHEVRGQVYLPYAQSSRPQLAFTVRTNGDPLALVDPIRDEVSRLDKDIPLYKVRPMDAYVDQARAAPRFTAVLFALFAVVALLLASVGIYGVTSYAVAQRTQEIGLRMALGAQRLDILKLIVVQGVGLTVAGVAIGLLLALGLTRFLENLLFGVRPTDAATFIVVSLVLPLVALLASYIPARRATKVDPMVALRYE
jgi:putative ABC transport system permease protein